MLKPDRHAPVDDVRAHEIFQLQRRAPGVVDYECALGEHRQAKRRDDVDDAIAEPAASAHRSTGPDEKPALVLVD